MLNAQTTQRLQDLRLSVLAAAWEAQSAHPDIVSLSFDDRFGLLVEAEWLARDNKRLATRLKEAKLKHAQACLENVDYPARRELDRSQMRQLASCQWVEEHQGIIVTGPTGVGKTFVACALAQPACRKGYRVQYRRASRLFDELALARVDGSWAKLLTRLARLDVLVIDDIALTPLAERERRDLLEIMEDRYGSRSTILTSQVPTAQWHEYIGNPTVADALCERLLTNTHRVTLKGPSRRKEKSGDE